MKNPLNLKYAPKVLNSICFFTLLLMAYGLFKGRKSDSFHLEFITNFLPDFYSHISNFSISYILYSCIGYLWLMQGVKFKYIIVLGIAFIASNLIYELFIDLLNTPDIIDAYYGLFGTCLAFLFLSLTYKYGFKRNLQSKR